MELKLKLLVLSAVCLSSAAGWGWDDDETQTPRHNPTTRTPSIRTPSTREPHRHTTRQHEHTPSSVKPTHHHTPELIKKPEAQVPHIKAVPLGGGSSSNSADASLGVVVKGLSTYHAADLLPADDFYDIRTTGNRALYLAKLLKQFAANRQPFETDARTQMQNFIFRWFKLANLHVEQEEFTFHVVLSDQSTMKMTGKNIIGYLPGKQQNSTNDRLLVIGAHYDTNDITHGISDNGAAAAAMLDVAKTLSERVRSKNITLQRTVAFAALDIQIPEYTDFETRGHSGVNRFVNYLSSKYLKTNSGVQAIILHSVLNYRPEKNSQKLSPGFSQDLPWEYRNITGDGSKGDFLAAVSLTKLNQSVDNALIDELQAGWDRAKVRNPNVRAPFRLRQWHLEEGAPETDFNKLFQTQGQQEFWYAKDANNQRIHLPAILVTDTGDLRPINQFCIPDCSNLEKKIPLQIEFLAQLIDSLVNAAVHLQTDGAGSAVMSSVLLVVLCAMSHLIRNNQE